MPKPPAFGPAATSPKPYKLKKAIENPHQFTVKMVPATKVALKVLAAQLGVSYMTMFADALIELLAAPPESIDYAQPPKGGTVRFVFKVTQELARTVHALADAMGVPCQAVILEAARRLLDKYGVKLDD